MRTTAYKFQWFEKEDRRKTLRASVDLEGKLRLGRSLREKLPRFIRVGFDDDAIVLAIADGLDSDIDCPASGVVSMKPLSKQIEATGLRLPVAFDMERDAHTGYLLGRVVPRRRRDSEGRRQYDVEQLLVLYRPLLKRVVYQMGRSTPLSERKAIAMEALCSAIRDYRPGCGSLNAYLEEQVRLALRRENRYYSETYSHRSLDQPLSRDGEEDFCLYDTIADGDEGAWDRRMDRERFASPPTSGSWS